MVGKPAELEEAEIVEYIAQKYHVLPGIVLAQDAAILRHLAILHEGRPA